MRALGALLCLALLTGCAPRPSAREMGDMALLRTMGVDLRQGEVGVTVSTGPQAKGTRGEEGPALLLSAQAPSISGACLALEGGSERFIFYGYVDQLLLGETLARQDIRPVLDYFATDRELGLGSQIWAVLGGTAGQALESGGRGGLEGRLSTLRLDGEMGVAPIPRTVGEVYADLLEQGAAFCPALALREGELVPEGYAVFRDMALAGVLTGERARGLELLAGQVSADILDIDGIPVEIRAARTRPKLVMAGGELEKLQIVCKVTAHVAEGGPGLSEDTLERLKAQTAHRAEERLAAALELLQELGTDCTGLGPRAAQTHPVGWQALYRRWPEHFAGADIEVQMQVELYR